MLMASIPASLSRPRELDRGEVYPDDLTGHAFRHPGGERTPAGPQLEDTARVGACDGLEIPLVRARQRACEVLRIVALPENRQMKELAPLLVVQAGRRGEYERDIGRISLPPLLRRFKPEFSAQWVLGPSGMGSFPVCRSRGATAPRTSAKSARTRS